MEKKTGLILLNPNFQTSFLCDKIGSNHKALLLHTEIQTLSSRRALMFELEAK